MQRAVSVVRLALSMIGRSQQKQYIMFYNTVVLVLLGHKIQGFQDSRSIEAFLAGLS
jgi:hypothetical protein